MFFACYGTNKLSLCDFCTFVQINNKNNNNNVFNRLLCTMFWDNVWSIIPLPLNWVWDASLVGKCELL